MLPYRDIRLTRVLIVLFFLLVAGSAYFEARGALFGPSIEIPETTITTGEQFVHVRGRAERIVELRLNGGAIPVTEEGDFDEPYVLAPGVNHLTLEASDAYGRSAKRTLTIVYTGEAASLPAEAASTSPATSTPATSTPLLP